MMINNDKFNRMVGSRSVRWLGIGLLSILILALAVWVVNSLIVEPALEKKLVRYIREASQQRLSVDTDSLGVDVDLIGGAIELRNLQVRPDSTWLAGDAGDPTMSTSGGSLQNLWLNCARVRVSGFGIGDLISGGGSDASSLLNDRDITVKCRSFRWEPDAQPYRIAAASFEYATASGTFRVDTLRLIPRLPKYEFARAIGREIDRIDLTIPLLEFRGIDQQALTAGREMRAGELRIENMQLEVFHDKRMAGGQPEYKPLPQEYLQNSPYPLHLDTLTVRNADITYAEHKNLVEEPGRIRFQSLDADFSSLTSLEPRNFTMVTRSRFLGEADLQLLVHFVMEDDSGRHSIRGSMGPLEMSVLNPEIQNLAFIRASSGTLHGMRFSIDLDRESSSGEVVLDYENLKIEVLHREDPAESGGRALQSFLANTFVIKRDNHEEPLRRGTVSFERVEEKSIFNYWWKSLLSGLSDNVGI